MFEEILANAGLLLGIVTSIAVLTSMYTLNRRFKKYDHLIDKIEELTTMDVDDKGELLIHPKLGKLIQGFSSSMAGSIKMSFLGELSGNKRLEAGLEGAIASDIIEQKLPLLGLAADFLGPETLKYVKKHPQALGQLVQLAAPLLQGRTGTPQQNNGGAPAGSVPQM